MQTLKYTGKTIRRKKNLVTQDLYSRHTATKANKHTHTFIHIHRRQNGMCIGVARELGPLVFSSVCYSLRCDRLQRQHVFPLTTTLCMCVGTCECVRSKNSCEKTNSGNLASKIDLEMRTTVCSIALLVLITCTLVSTKPPPPTKNHDLLTKIGLQRIRGPNSHHRKRLAVESRHHSRSDDSHMFIIKLPPNPHYYVHNRPNDLPIDKNIPVGFKSNGKPAKVYHWNIPVIKKHIAQHKSRTNDLPQDPESWNEVLDKPEKERKPIKPSYYVPMKPKKSSFMKYFPGNGKPHSFYVIEKSKKAHYHRLLP